LATPTRTRTRLAREERREQIVDAAAVVFQRRDPAEVTFEEIAEAAGVSRALVYNYFGDRHGVLEAVYLRNVRLLDAQVTAALATTPGLEEALTASVRVHVHFAERDPWGYRYAAGEVGFARLPELVAGRVDRAADVLGGGPEAGLVMAGVMHTVQAMVTSWLDHREVPPERVVELITAYLARGLAGIVAAGLPLTPTWPVPA